MNPLSGMFGLAVMLRNMAYDRGWKQRRRLGHAVVSVGNLRVGGPGKTPFVIALGRLLQQQQVAFDVLSRGYGRVSSRTLLVDARGEVGDFGDEPLLLAQKLEVPVVVGARRFAAGEYAERLFAEARPAHGEWLHLLDDGFQHRALARDFDIVLLAPEDLTDQLLPLGRMREPLRALHRADVIAVPAEMDVSSLGRFEKEIWRFRRKLRVPQGAPRLAVAVAGIARPQRFFDDLRAAGVEVVREERFADHHRFTQSDVAGLLARRRQCGAEGFITTEKDALRLRGFWQDLQPVIAAGLEFDLADGAARVREMLAVVAARRAGTP